MREEFVEAAKSQVNKGIYVWGGNGENLLCIDNPDAWIRKKETSTANAKRAMALFTARRMRGIDPIRAFDCSGLVYWCNTQAKIGYGDKNANGYWRECEPVDELMPGDLVFHHNGLKCTHVGIYIGDGQVVESIGRDEGVVITTEKSRKDKGYWNRRGRLKKMILKPTLLGDANCDGEVTAADASLILRYLEGLSDISEQGKVNADVNGDGKITKEDADIILNHLVGAIELPTQKIRVIGKSVNVREGDSTKYKKLGIAHNGDVFTCLGVAPSGWYKIEYKGRTAYISNRKDLTQKV